MAMFDVDPRYLDAVRGLMTEVGMIETAAKIGERVLSKDDIIHMCEEATLRIKLARTVVRPEKNEGFTSQDAEDAERAPAVPFLRRSLSTYAERRGTYGASEQRFADIAVAMFPGGLRLSTRTDWLRFGLFFQIISKLSRYTENFFKPHVDSIHDLQPYSAMLEAEDRRELGRAPFRMDP